MTTSVSNNNDIERVLPWDRFHDWVHAICVVTFDLELGQALESIHPSHARLSDQERYNVCYLAFPDSNSGCMGDTQFQFRLPRSPGPHSLTVAQQRYNAECPPSLQIDPSFLHGFAYFRQVKDRSLRRGYFQKSVILLTRLPFVNLFSKLTAMVSGQFFDGAADVLDDLCRDVDHWPQPDPGVTLTLSVRSHSIQTRIPHQLDKLLSSVSSVAVTAAPPTSSCTLLPSIHEPDLCAGLQPVLGHVQLLWELVVTCEPLVVMTTTPAVCSNVVHSLVSCIWPLRYAGDYRPFFTIHDSDFREMTQLGDGQAPPPVILGVTNPFFVKTLRQWPHLLHVGDSDAVSRNAASQKYKVRKAVNLKTLDTKPGLYTQYKPFLLKDKSTDKKLLKGLETARPDEAQSALLRRYLQDLTQSFIMPLERYIATLMPLQRTVSPYKAAPVMRPFNPDDFCRRLDDMGPHLTTGIKGDWAGLYRRFFRSANFSEWFNCRHVDISRKLHALHLEALGDADVLSWARDKQEVELVDMALRLRRKLSEAAADRQLPVHANTLAKLRLQLLDVTAQLPEGLRAALKPPS